MPSLSPSRKSLGLIFAVTALIALGFAFYTQHVWEDYYITFRSSKNLATGHGLVFNPGDRLHTFTSPLGVLLPSLAYLLTFNSSDEAALWIFRVMSAAALGGAAVLFTLVAREKNYGKLAAGFIVAALALDSKTVDFSINGMETAFLVLFLAYALWAHLTAPRRAWLHLGAAWAGLMWTRPDSFIYVGLIAAGFWLFNDSARTGVDRRQMLALFLKAGLVTTALYLPWLITAWAYYGTPVPHTITAKSGIGDPRTLTGLLNSIWQLPLQAWSDEASLASTFLPAYYMIGGWPQIFVKAAATVSAACALLWLLPFLRVETRAASFAFFGAHVYLSYYPYFPFPWYIPSTTVLAVFALGGVVDHIQQAADRRLAPARATGTTRVLGGLVALLLVGTTWATAQSARLFQAQQEFVETGNRRQIGEWLRAQAKPGDTVFMEPLGYIGYFSGLKTYDFPGMSSREMVAARQAVGNLWADLIYALNPSWLVLRPAEIDRVNERDPELLASGYTPVREFSVVEPLSTLDRYGMDYLRHDAHFIVFRQQRPLTPPIKPADVTSPFPSEYKIIAGRRVYYAHAPSTIRLALPPKATRATIPFGLNEEAYTGTEHLTDGAIFSVELEDGANVTQLIIRHLEPVSTPADRGLQQFVFDLPAYGPDARLILRADSGGTTSKDWTYWGNPVFDN